MIPLFIILPAAFGCAAPPADTDGFASRARTVEEHYARWVGVPAPEMGPNARDRVIGPVLELNALRGKRVLLLGITGAGDFVNAPDRRAFAATLEAVKKARQEHGEKLAVVGFTKSLNPGLPAEVPVVQVTNRTFREPYELLLGGLGGFLIDTRGVITKVYTRPLTPEDILEAGGMEDWKGEARSAPSTDPWEGKGPPWPRFGLAKAWSRKLQVIGGTGGDWDLDGTPDVIAAARGRILVLSTVDGSTREEIEAPTIKGRHETLQWAEIQKGTSAILHYPGGWPHTVPVIDQRGKVVWSYPPGRHGGINAAAWVDLDGDGSVEMLVGSAGKNGLQLVSSRGEKLWGAGDLKNVWAVAGIGASAERPGLALAADGEVHVYDVAGRRIRSLDNHGYHAAMLGARNMSASGDRQVLTLGEPFVGQGAMAIAQDLEGRLLWKFPLGREAPHRAIGAADLTGDGVLEWVLEWPEEGLLMVLDARGSLLARLMLKESFTACFPVPRKSKPAFLCVATRTELMAFTLEP